MEGLSTELDFALKSRDPYPINLESLVDLLKYKHISSLTTHLKRHFQRDIDYKKFHQVRNKRQICVYYISVDCFKQICGFCRHTQRKEIAQNLLGTMSVGDMKTEDMSFTEMLNDIDLRANDSDDEDEKMRQSSPPTKSIKVDRGNFVTKDTQSPFNKYTRPQKLVHRNTSDATAQPAFSNNIYNFNNLSATPITPIIPTFPIASNNKSTLTSSLASASFTSPSSLTANALANAALSNTNNAFINNNYSNFNNQFSNNNFNCTNPTFNPFLNNSFAPIQSTPAPTPSISSFSSSAASFNPVTNINTITPFSNQAIITPTFTTEPTTNPNNSHKRSNSSRSSPIPSITEVTSTITPTPVLASSTLTPLPITAPITATPILSSAASSTFSSKNITHTPTKSSNTQSPSMARAVPIPVKPTVAKYGLASKSGSILNYKANETEFKADPEAVNLFDFGLISQPEMQFYDDYLTLSSSPTTLFDPVNTLAEVDKIYEQWEQERGGPRITDWPQ